MKERFTIYYYEVERKWFVYDTQTDCLVGGTGTTYKQQAADNAASLNETNKTHITSNINHTPTL